MSESLGGLPLLSGPPPELEHDGRAEVACRKCCKEFNILFTRGRRCNHCGYSYCQSCTDYQALMPRPSPSSGYDPVPVCAFCVQYLSITAGGKGYLRAQSLGKLKNYMQAYNLLLGPDVLEKEDVINAILTARDRNGCLPRSNESYYRKHAVPYGQNSRPRGLFSRPETIRSAPRQNIDPSVPWAQANSFARPDLRPDQPQSEQRSRPQQQEHQQQRQQPYYAQNNQYAPPPNPPPHAPYTSQQSFSSASSGRYASGNVPQPQPNNSVPNVFPQANHSSDPRSRTTSVPNRSANTNQNAQPSSASNNSSRLPPVPTLDELLAMQEDEIATLSVGSLKEVLDRNHVPARLVLEKSELVARIVTLVATERRERARMEAIHEREEWEAQEREWAARERERAVRAREKEAREREERERELVQERGRRRETYRTTVESASESDSDSGVHQHSPELDPESRDRASSPPPSPSPPIIDIKERFPQAARDESPEPLTRPRPERSGLCVVCQDEEANIVILDCGHLALCRACADLIWGSTRECPLCRTRIVTESRLLRIFKA